jgi:hypothetical protein
MLHVPDLDQNSIMAQLTGQVTAAVTGYWAGQLNRASKRQLKKVATRSTR